MNRSCVWCNRGVRCGCTPRACTWLIGVDIHYKQGFTNMPGGCLATPGDALWTLLQQKRNIIRNMCKRLSDLKTANPSISPPLLIAEIQTRLTDYSAKKKNGMCSSKKSKLIILGAMMIQLDKNNRTCVMFSIFCFEYATCYAKHVRKLQSTRKFLLKSTFSN